jgi:hypothetical protein
MLALALCIAAGLSWRCQAQIYDTNNVVVQTFAGSGFSGYVDGQGTQTMFDGPVAIVADSSSNLFVMDYGNFRIRKITPDGAVSTFVGGGPGSLPGYGTNVSFGIAVSMTIDHSDTLYLLDYNSGTSMFRIGSDGYVSRIPLNGLAGGASHSGICVDSVNNIYISDPGNKIYRYRTNGVLEVFAGSGNLGSIDGNGIFTSFNSPQALAADSADNIYVWDSGYHLIRRINQNRDVVTIAGRKNVTSDSDGVGTNATFGGISAMSADNSGNIYIASWGGGSSIRKMTATTNVATLAGSFTQSGYANGAGSLARFDFGDEGICISQGTIFVADFSNQRIRNITFNPSAQPVLPANLQLDTYPGLRIVGTVGRAYQIQTSPDLTNWTTRTTLLLNSSPYIWIDQNPVSGNKFYRAFLLP